MAILLVCVFIISLILIIYLDVNYSYEKPHSPQVEVGRIYELNINHGSIIYVNREELEKRNFVTYFFVFGGFCAGIAALLNIKYQVFKPWETTK